MKKGNNMQNLTKLGLCALLVALLVNLSACGKVSKAVPIEGSGYPHTYPRH